MALVVIGAVLCAISLVLWVRLERSLRAHRAWCAGAARAEGVVSRIGRRHWLSRNEPTSDDRVLAMPVVRFRATNGVEYEFDAPDAPRQAGAAVAVAYDPALPSNARTVVRLRRGGCIVLMFVVGLALAASGAIQQ